jgi:hypothetical protein
MIGRKNREIFSIVRTVEHASTMENHILRSPCQEESIQNWSALIVGTIIPITAIVVEICFTMIHLSETLINLASFAEIVF